MGKLTALKVKALKEPGRHPDGDGLYLLVKASGARSWMLRAQVDGKRRDFGLGSEKDVTLAEARDRAADLRKQYRSGVDPVEAKREAKGSKRVVPTFAEAAKLAHAEFKGGWKNDKHGDQWIATLTTHAFPKLGPLRVDKVDAGAIISALQPIWLKTPETARRVKQRIGTVLDWAYSQGFRQAEAPMRAIAKGLKQQPKKDGHFAALPFTDAPALMSKLSSSDTTGRLALRFTILTAARSGETRGAVWGEIDLDEALWTIPAQRMKASRVHVVPLSAAAVAVLKIAKGEREVAATELVFPGNRQAKLSDMTLSKALKAATTTPATVHGFRSSFRDWAAETQPGVSDAVVEAALAHTNPNKVEAAYRRTNYLEQRRKLMQEWADHLLPAISSGNQNKPIT
ncbi:integrase arm-type DNA-binding domain-containing protein [uncultured Sphingomonas sp.]|uniref:tyrosine-type recombinase/integrase n=1 Tax=uncultured Sphingomonas sp. TaxID=158754 RepID=UPI0025EB9BB9|nr:integrase arm-type DNA-binding domain-containing protein [uncultured Sphingomonas sp.]